MKYSYSGSGLNGFIGSNLVEKLSFMDRVDDPREADYYFHFGSPSSQILFNRELDRSIQDTVGDFLSVCKMCRDNHIKLIYPSSATIYDADNSYSHCKSALEEIQKAYDFPMMSFRIFAGYGDENRKKDYASVVYQWIKTMKLGNSPCIYGDGSQSRDFVYIDDIVRTIIDNIDNDGVMDIGTGVSTSFNKVIEMINEELGEDIKPVYVSKPKKYLEKTVCKTPLKRFVTLREGIRRICA